MRWDVRRVEETGSTNADVREWALAGEPEGVVLVAGLQTAGRGRLDRGWQSPAGAGLTFSVLLRPPVARVPARRWTWLPLLVGCAVAEGLVVPGVRLKWPNDVLLGEKKLGGILTERVETPSGPAAVAGIGLNVATPPDALPVPTATSLYATTGRALEPGSLLRPVLDALGGWYARWVAAAGDPAASGLAAAYRARCATLDRRVRVELGASGGNPAGLANPADPAGPARESFEGQAYDVDDDGRLIVATPDGDRTVGAGDVVHARLA